MRKRLVVGVSGASGAILAVHLLQALRDIPGWESHLVCTKGARITLAHETDVSYEALCDMAHVVHDQENIGASIASGSFCTQGMVVIPCSMKTLAGIAHGYASNLLIRAADVTLKERRKLLLLTRETPLHLGHLQNMVTATQIGAIIMPPMMTHYILPEKQEDMERHIVAKVLNEFGLEMPGFRRWAGLKAAG